MGHKQRVVPRRRHRRAQVILVKEWLRRREDRGQHHNFIAELYQEDQPSFRSLMRMSPEMFTEIDA